MSSDRPVKDDAFATELARLLVALRRHIAAILLCTLAFGAAALGLSLLQENRYTATSSLLFRSPELAEAVFGVESRSFSAADSARQAATNIQLVGLSEVSARTAEALGSGTSPAEIGRAVEAAPEGQSDIVSIRATHTDPEWASTVANEFAEQFIKFRAAADRRKLLQAQQLANRQYESLDPEDQAGPRGIQLSRGAERLGIMASLQTGNAELVQRAEPPANPSSPRTLRNTAAGLLVGLLAGLGLAYLLERLNRRLRHPQEAQEALELPLVGTIPESSTVRDAKKSPAGDLPFAETEAFRMMRASLQYFDIDRKLQVVAVTSAAAQEGKSTISWHLAAIASSTSHVVLIETDLRNPSLSRQHGVAAGSGLAEVLTNQTTYVEARRRQQGVGTHTFDFIPAGLTPPNPSELLESRAMENLLSDLREDYQLIVVDTAPAGVVSDAFPILTQADGVLLVTRMNRTTRESAQSLATQLRRTGSNLMGVIANGVKVPRFSRYGYGSAYGYGGEDQASRQTRRQP